MRLIMVNGCGIYIRTGEDNFCRFSMEDAQSILADLPNAIEVAREFRIREAKANILKAQIELDRLEIELYKLQKPQERMKNGQI